LKSICLMLLLLTKIKFTSIIFILILFTVLLNKRDKENAI
jgi:hypothetical protein